MSVLRNYFHIGTTWLVPGGPENKPRGANLLANTVLESFQQDKNCFSCHRRRKGQSFDTYPVSNILPR